MDKVKKLIDVVDRLLGPDGCPWDKAQTFESLRSGILEEVYELIEAIDLKDDDKILEELGDLLFMSIFLCKLGEKGEKFTISHVAQYAAEKFISRHPHIFDDGKIDGIDEILDQWERIKSQEKGKTERISVLDDIPRGAPALTCAQEVIAKTRKIGYQVCEKNVEGEFSDERELGALLMEIAARAENSGLDAESALRKISTERGKDFREWERRMQSKAVE